MALLSLSLLAIVLRVEAGSEREIFGTSLGPLEVLFNRLSKEHEGVCQKSSTCKEFTFSEEASTCCGTCSCDTDCARYGSCCLGSYKNFTHARESMQNSRYSCRRAQYLPPQETDYNDPNEIYYWIVNKCDLENSDIISSNLCETPASFLEAIIPVTEPVSDVHYRNKFCAYCNGVDKTVPLIEWNFQIRSSEHLSFPMENFLSFIHRTSSNFFYEPPEYLSAQQCKPSPPYTVETCNETGLWSSFDDAIENACHSFLDPFNSTYKNYFCFLCNSPESVWTEDWICPPGSTQSRSYMAREPLYRTTLNPQFIEQNDVRLNCGNYQFQDEAAMVCRDVFCQDNHTLFHGKCIVSNIVMHENCFAIFIKMSVVRADMDVRIDYVYGQSAFAGYLQRSLETALEISNEIQMIQVFFHHGDTNLLDYVVAYVTFDFTDNLKSYDIVTSLIQLLYMEVDFHEIGIIFSLEFAVYNMTVSDEEAKIFVPNELNSFDTLHSNYSKPDYSSSTCSQNETVLINKLHFCPYIILDVDETRHLSMLGNDLVDLIEAVDDKQPVKSLTRWEDEIQDDKYYICLEDYFNIYQVMYRVKDDLTNESDNPKLLVYLYIVSAFVLMISY